MMIYVYFICVTFECARQFVGIFDMLKNHRNRACVRRFESKFIWQNYTTTPQHTSQPPLKPFARNTKKIQKTTT